MSWLIPVQLAFLWWFHQLTPVLGYFSIPDLSRMFHALFLSAITALGVWFFAGSGIAPPRGVIMADFVFALVGLTGVRLALRTIREARSGERVAAPRRFKRVGIMGAGDAGAVLVHELTLKPGLGLEPVAFFDDDRTKWKRRIHDVPVAGPPEKLVEVAEKFGIQEAVIAMPSAPARRVTEIVRMLSEAGIPCRTVPTLDQLALGQVRVSQLRNVEVQDLLGRESVELEIEGIRSALADRVVLVSGAGGSIGSELCRQIVRYGPRRLVLLERAEPSAFLIEQDLIRMGHRERITPIVADILDRSRLEQVFREFGPEVVFHAAAHKHVPMMEHQPGEAIRNNVLGTMRLAEVSLQFGVQRFTLISTDKAINPTNVMGATKRMAEMCILALHAANPTKTKFMAVRFGNVLGSSGSVIPTFQRQIASGGPVQVTHAEMTRYFMTIPEAAMLVVQSATQGQGGEVFVLDMGKPVKIMDLARQMIELSGLKPNVDIPIEIVGLRPGEKLFEEISYQRECMLKTAHPKILRFVAPPVALEEWAVVLRELEQRLFEASARELKLLLKRAVPEYQPYLNDEDGPPPCPQPSMTMGLADGDTREVADLAPGSPDRSGVSPELLSSAMSKESPASG